MMPIKSQLNEPIIACSDSFLLFLSDIILRPFLTAK